MEIEKDKVVSFNYKLTLENGEVVDSSKGREPLSFLVGAGQIIPGLEEELIGLQVGDTKEVKVEPEKAYGEKDDRLVQTINRSQVPDSVDLELDMVLRGQSESGEVVEGKVVGMEDDSVEIDFNHPLAGEPLKFDVEIVDIREASPEEKSHGHAH